MLERPSSYQLNQVFSGRLEHSISTALTFCRQELELVSKFDDIFYLTTRVQFTNLLGTKLSYVLFMCNLILESIAVDTNSGSVSINYPAASSSSSSGSSSSNNEEEYNLGFYYTFPHISLEGLTKEYINVISFLLVSAYVIMFVLSLLNLWPSTERVSGK